MRRVLVLVIAGLFLGSAAAPAAAAGWKARLDKIASGRDMSIVVRDEGESLYERKPRRKRVPASGQKLLLSMALLDHLGPETRFDTAALAHYPLASGVIQGDLFVVGHGDPTLTAGSSYSGSLAVTATKIAPLARAIDRSGIFRIEGSVVGSTSGFERDWWAPGWKSDFPRKYIPLPTALSFHGNRIDGKHVKNPEFRLARRLTRKLKSRGVEVVGAPRAGALPDASLSEIASVTSRPLRALLKHMNRRSSNFFAEVFGKRLGGEVTGQAGTIAAGAQATAEWAAGRRVTIEAHDGSGLSYSNRATARGMSRLLGVAERATWGQTLRMSLPRGGQGTLGDRLKDVKVRAKTGTLASISTLSGYVWLQRTGSWAEFSIMSRDMPKWQAASIEDRIVRKLSKRAR